MKCHRCKHEWEYKGSSDFYITCPNCYSKTKREGYLISSEEIKNLISIEDLKNEINLLIQKKLDSFKVKKENKPNGNNKRCPIGSRLRHEVFKRDNYTCKECGATKEEITLHVDHIIPFSQGGTDELDNLQTLCETCNLSKSNKHWVGGIKVIETKPQIN